MPAVSELADKLWKRLLPEKKPQQITRKKITCLDSRRKKKRKGRTQIKSGKAEGRGETVYIGNYAFFFFQL